MANQTITLSVAGNNKPIVSRVGVLVTDKTYSYAVLDGASLSTTTFIQAGTIDLVSGEGTITIIGGSLIASDPVIVMLQDPSNLNTIGAYEMVISTSV